MGNHKKILVKCKKITPRLQYVCDHIADFFDEVSVLLIETNSDESLVDVIIGYGIEADNCDVLIPSHVIMHEVGVSDHEIIVGYQEGLPFLFESLATGSDFPCDIMALIFYSLSRYEEYGVIEKDQHGRYKSQQSFAVRHDFLSVALVDRWLLQLRRVIADKTGVVLNVKRMPTNGPSLDIDMPYAYRGKGFKAYLGILKDLANLDFSSSGSRMKYWLTGDDPFNTYDYITEEFRRCGAKANVFILNRHQKPHDENHLAATEELASIVAQLSEVAEIGIHPSYTSHEGESFLIEELASLEKMTKLCGKSRQHFIKMSMPATYAQLLKHGITQDHSMIYPDRVGFRAGTARPFRWYDLSHERSTDLMIYPYQVMDVTMRYYLNQSPSQAISSIESLRKEAHEVGGSLGWIWHNSSLSKAYGWGEWKQVFEHLILL